MKSADARYAAPLCCLIALAGADGWAFLPHSGNAVLEAAFAFVWMLAFYCAPAALLRLRAVPFSVRTRGAIWLLIPAAFASAAVCARLTVFWCRALFRAGIFVSAISAPLSWSDNLPLLFSACLAPAFCEEFLFRGVMLPAAPRRTLFFSSAVFALFHGAGSFPVSFCNGLILGRVALTWGLLPAALYHFCFNAGVLFFSMVPLSGWILAPAAALWFALLAASLKWRREAPESAKASPSLCAALFGWLCVRLILSL